MNTGSKRTRGWWEAHQGPLPMGVLRGWNACGPNVNGDNLIWAGVFEVTGVRTGGGNSFVLVYHKMGSIKATTERFVGLQLALDRATAVLNGGGIIGRPRGTNDPEFYKKNVPGVKLA